MRLLLITRKVDNKDPRVGFFSQWVDAFAQQVESMIVITWQQSSSEILPDNVTLLSLSGSLFTRIRRLKQLIWKHRKKYDVAFIHMNPEYVLVAAPLLRMLGKPVALWYTHKSVTLKRRIAERLVTTIFTASAKSFRKPLRPQKVNVVGHGIPVGHFHAIKAASKRNPYSLVTVSRISPTKDIETMIKAVHMLKMKGNGKVRLSIVGAPAIGEDATYDLALKQMVKNMNLTDNVIFRGPVAYADLPLEYQHASIALNLSSTGSLDKSILEAMASGCIVITSNEAAHDLVDKRFFVETNNDEMLCAAIERAAHLSDHERKELCDKNLHTVNEYHSLDQLIQTILKKL